VGEQAGDIRHQAQPGAAFQFQQRLARHRQVAFVGQFAGHHAIEGGGNPAVAGQRFGLGHRRLGDLVAGLRGVQFGLGGRALLVEPGCAVQVQLRLPERGAGLVEPGLNLQRRQFHQHVALFDGLSERGGQAGDAAADLGLEHGLEPGKHGSDDLLQGGLAHRFDFLQAHGGRRQGRPGARGRRRLFAAAVEQGGQAREQQAGAEG